MNKTTERMTAIKSVLLKSDEPMSIQQIADKTGYCKLSIKSSIGTLELNRNYAMYKTLINKKNFYKLEKRDFCHIKQKDIFQLAISGQVEEANFLNKKLNKMHF